MSDQSGEQACGTTTTLLSEYVDGQLEWREQQALRSHLRDCRTCAAVVADFRDIRIAAAALPFLTPDRDLWPDVSARLEKRGAASHAAPRPRRMTVAEYAPLATTRWLLAAAATLILGVGLASVVGVGTYESRGPARVAVTSTQARPGRAPSGDPAVSPRLPGGASPATRAPAGRRLRSADHRPTATLVPAAAHRDAFDGEIRRLRAAGRRALRSADSALDPRTTATLARDLAALDTAVAETHAAFVQHARHEDEGALAGRQLHHLLDRQLALVETIEALGGDRDDR